MATRSERAEAVRALVREAKHGLLSTNGLEPAGFPHGSLVPVEARYVGGFGAAAWVSGSELTGR